MNYLLEPASAQLGRQVPERFQHSDLPHNPFPSFFGVAAKLAYQHPIHQEVIPFAQVTWRDGQVGFALHGSRKVQGFRNVEVFVNKTEVGRQQLADNKQDVQIFAALVSDLVVSRIERPSIFDRVLDNGCPLFAILCMLGCPRIRYFAKFLVFCDCPNPLLSNERKQSK
ncbi:hypothetical protein HYW84_02655 [Candidatus Peregrinibacteria bacterium]|nr:hypothetical protein [Candidatus Peregrinibacteria bacterium]